MVNEEETTIMAGRTLEEMIFEVGVKSDLTGLEELHYNYATGLVGTKKLTREEFQILRDCILNELEQTIADICRTSFEDILEQKVMLTEELQE